MIGAFSFFSYIWLLLIIDVFSPNVIELWEAATTFLLFPILMFIAYATHQLSGNDTDHDEHQTKLALIEKQSKHKYNNELVIFV